MKERPTIRKTDNGWWRWSRVPFGFSVYELECADFEAWDDAIRYANDRTISGGHCSTERADERGDDSLAARPRWSPLYEIDGRSGSGL